MSELRGKRILQNKRLMASFLSTRLNERSNPTGLLFSFVGGATLSSNRALRAFRAQQNPVRIRRQSRRGARSQAAGRANLRRRQNSGIVAHTIARLPKVCYNKIRKAVNSMSSSRTSMRITTVLQGFYLLFIAIAFLSIFLFSLDVPYTYPFMMLGNTLVFLLPVEFVCLIINTVFWGIDRHRRSVEKWRLPAILLPFLLLCTLKILLWYYWNHDFVPMI